ncbi:MAG TPA: histidine phosphatase family protein [Steroidobacteraceae bacterium]|nr:histidine phosphatase family protein [Steroidobacteraceae bacterium]
MDLYLIRHTRPAIDSGICYGRLDVALPPDFAVPAARLQEALPPGVPLVTAEAQRCRLLAAHLATALRSKLTVDDRLRELDFGEWEGRPWHEIPRAQTDAWTKDVWNHAAPGGESYAAMYARVRAVWETLLDRDLEALALIGSAGPLRALLTIALELPTDAFVRLHLDYGGIAKLSDATGGWRLEFANR